MNDSPPIYTIYNQLRGDGVRVHCPKCNKEAILSYTKREYCLVCYHCYFREIRIGTKPVAAAQGCCMQCERWFNIRLSANQSVYKKVKVQCPHCSTIQIAAVKPIGMVNCDILDGLSFYFQTQFRGHTIWAINRAHLNYLITYIEADVREKCLYPNGSNQWYRSSGQEKYLPKWMKTAKNRKGILNVLHKMQEQN